MLRTDLWVSAFVRRHNDIGMMCVVSRRGDPIAGQIFIEIDHLNGEFSLYAPAPAAARLEKDDADRVFHRRFSRVEADVIRKRLVQEEEFDPDFWVIALDLRSGEPDVELVG